MEESVLLSLANVFRMLAWLISRILFQIEDIGYGSVASKLRRVNDWEFIVFK